MPALVAGIDVLVLNTEAETWMVGHRRAKATPSFGRLSLGMTTVWFGDGKHAKLLRGQALPDMRDSDGKVTEYCGKSRLETPESVNFFEIGPKFLAAQRHTF